MEDMSSEYNDHCCHECGEELSQLAGDWLCPDCDDVDKFIV